VSPPLQPPSRLGRSLGLGGAITIGVSAMVGTGVFAVWQPALDRAGSLLVVAVLIAAAVAALNATSTARLASRHPEAGGVYAYGRARLGRIPGAFAGVVFLVGKTASASAAALTIGLYAWPEGARLVGLGAIAAVLALNLRGVVRSTRVAGVLVAAVIAVLFALVFAAVVAPAADQTLQESLAADAIDGWGLLAASALIFVAFAGYARITVLGEEVRDPARVIPAAVAGSFVIVVVVYLAVAFAVQGVANSGQVIGSASLSNVAAIVAGEPLVLAVSLAAVLAAGAVLMSLIAGVGRTLFAMADAGDGPRFFAAVGRRSRIPVRAEVAAAVVAASLVLVGGLTFSLALSAGMILTYYAIAHVAALRLDRRRGMGGWLLAATPVVGLAGCATLVVAVLVAG